jgi:hypothetical protein
MKKISLTWTVIIYAIVCASTAMAVTPTEREALLALYNSTDGQNWTNKNGWDGEEVIDECDWDGITCQDSTVTWLYLNDNQLTGTLPPALGNLAGLTVLDLSQNQLSGSIPPEIGNLTDLEELALGNNLLDGSIPPEIGNLTGLDHIYLQENQLTGPIPSEIGKLTSLQDLKLGNNELSGSIPAGVGNLENLILLDLRVNQLTGNIPASFRRLQSDCYVYITGNCLTDCFENASHLTIIGADTQNDCQIPLILGDITGDGNVNIQDAILMLKISSNNVESDIPINGGADLNCDNVMGHEEMIYILQSAAELRQ